MRGFGSVESEEQTVDIMWAECDQCVFVRKKAAARQGARRAFFWL